MSAFRPPTKRFPLEQLTGSIVALVTPMHDDGSVDYPALRRLIDWHIDEGTDCLGVVGTTGGQRNQRSGQRAGQPSEGPGIDAAQRADGGRKASARGVIGGHRKRRRLSNLTSGAARAQHSIFWPMFAAMFGRRR